MLETWVLSDECAKDLSSMTNFNLTRRNCLALAGTMIAARSVHAREELQLGDTYKSLYEQAAEEGQVVYYTSARTEEARRLSEIWKSNFPDVTLTIVGKNAPELITQIEAERAAAQNRADLVTMTQPYIAEIWKANGLYQSYKARSFDQLAPDYADPDGAYYVSGVYLLPAAYNTRTFADKAQLPRTLADFLDAKWKGQLVLAHPATAGNSRTFFLGLLQAGKIDWAWIEGLARQDVLFVRGNPEAARIIAAGERPLAPMVSSLNILTSREKGQAIDFFGLEDGTLVAEQPTGIMTGAAHPRAAELLLEFLISAEGQEARADAGKFWPTNAEAAPVAGLPKLADLGPIKIDLAKVADETAAQDFLKRFDQVFGRE